MEEYLAEWRENHRHLLKKSQGTPEVSVGDVMIVHNNGLPCSFWNIGRIQALILGKDGKPRGATVGIAGQTRRFTSLYRPLQLLYPLEVTPSPELTNTQEETQEPKNVESMRGKKSQKTSQLPSCALNVQL